MEYLSPPRFWEARDQTQTSLAPGGGKMRDPGKEVVDGKVLELMQSS